MISAARRQWAWRVSAMGYRWADLRVARIADADLFAYVGGRLPGSRVADCGCGPGLLSEKLACRGVSYLMAIDGNSSMVRQAGVRLAPFIESGVVEVVHRLIDPTFFNGLQAPFDLIIFKRSLYASRQESISILKAAAGTLGPRGAVVVVHPERSLRRYAFGDPHRIRRHTVFHLVNRLISVMAVWLGISEYRTYSATELVNLLVDAVPEGRIDIVPITQQAYNVAALVIAD